MMLFTNNQCHFNPASAGATLALDARFNGYADAAEVTSWASRLPATGTADSVPAQGTPNQDADGLNGLPAVYYDAASLLEGDITYSGEVTVIAVAAMASDAGVFARLVSLYRNGVNDYDQATTFIPLLRLNSEAINSYQNTATYNATAITYGTAFIASAIYSSSAVKTGLNGVIASSAGSFSSLDIDRVGVGTTLPVAGNQNWKGPIAAVAIFPSAISDALRRRVEESLSRVYRIPVS